MIYPAARYHDFPNIDDLMISNDAPIEHPDDDQYGVDPFSMAIANAIAKLPAPRGTVLALTGAWGSGKSSVVNLVRHHLAPIEHGGDLKIITFNPWWYSDEHLLTRAFFQHLYSGLGKALSENARKVLLRIARGVLTAGPVVSAANFLTFGIGGSLAEKATSAAAGMIKIERTVEDEFKALSDELENQQKRFLVIIDDIDRLSPEQALLVFRLVKSVGRLSNVIYLLAFDRDFAERVLNQRYPAERHFLEKIVQASFEVPAPDVEILHEQLLRALVELVGHPQDEGGVRFRNILIDLVNPLVVLPRDVVRFLGNFSVTWAAIGGEVDAVDLMAIEALRLFRFPLYQAIRSHKLMLCGTSGSAGQNRKEEAARYETILLGSIASNYEREELKIALRRLFPRLDSVWGNVLHSSSEQTWRAKRRISDPKHFSSYFRLALGADILPRAVVDNLFKQLGQEDFVKEFFRKHATVVRQSGQSDVPIILGELTAGADRISNDEIAPFLGALFEIADELDIKRDEGEGGFREGNDLRLHWLLNPLVRDRLSQPERNEIFRAVVPRASLGWAISLVSRLRNEYFPHDDRQKKATGECFVDESVMSELVSSTLNRIRLAASNDEIEKQHHLVYVLFRWDEFSDQPGEEVKKYSDARLARNSFVVRLAAEVTSTAWVSSIGWDGLGDRVSRGVTQVQLDGYERILDVEKFLTRVSEVERVRLDDSSREILARFRDGLKNTQSEKKNRRPAPPSANACEGVDTPDNGGIVD